MKPLKILFAEPNDLARTGAEQILDGHKVITTTTKNGALETITVAQAQGEPFDLFIISSTIDGFEDFVRALERAFDTTTLIVMSTGKTPTVMKLVRELGLDHLEKPLKRKVLLAAIQTVTV